MRRSTIQRRTPLARGKTLARSARLEPVNRERKAKTFARNFGDRGAAVRVMRCLACDVERSLSTGGLSRIMEMFELDLDAPDVGGVQAAHARARGMGGAHGDRRDLVPLCSSHHAEAGELRTSQRADFERRYSLSLTDEAARIAAELDERGLP